jgi:hypothetical protein
MPKAANSYCQECTWGATPITAVLALNRKKYDEENFEDQLVMNGMYDKDTVMAESCNACCLRQASSCINKPVLDKTLADAQIIVEGAKQKESMKSGMCSFWLETRTCTMTSLSGGKKECIVDFDLQQLVSAAPANVISVASPLFAGMMLLGTRVLLV